MSNSPVSSANYDHGSFKNSSESMTRGKFSDFFVVAVIVAVVAVFIFVPSAMETFRELNRSYGLSMSFIKFAILATFGELLALRLTEKVYLKPGFGVIPKALVWGLLGITIKISFSIFATGVPSFLAHMNFPIAAATFQAKLFTAFSISVLMNLAFAPVLMTLHKMSDIHIASTGGTLGGMFSSIDCGDLLKRINWDVMWNFVFKKTIPFFWIPAHTITFLLPPDLRVACAALLGMALGCILAFAGTKK